MPRVSLKKDDYLLTDTVKKLKGELAAEGLDYNDVAIWLGCTPQNVGQLFIRRTFSLRQYIIIRNKLDERYRINTMQRERELELGGL